MLKRSLLTLITSVIASMALAAPSTTVLFDGRILDGQTTLPGPSLADLPTVEDELKLRLQEPYLQALVGQVKVQQGTTDFTMRAGFPGSFTRPGARQKAFLYRLGLSSGLVVTENDKVVAHYNGVPAEYAYYLSALGVDLNADGLTDLVLTHNTEDSEAVECHVFTMTVEGPLFSGSTRVFSSNVQAGAEKPAQLQADAYRVSLTPGRKPRLTQDHYHRSGSGPWRQQSAQKALALENRQAPGYEPKLLQIRPTTPVDQARIQVALNKLSSYADVGSSIDYARPAPGAQTLVASNPGLRLMELLDTRAAVYAYENATKQQTDHKNPQKHALSLEGLNSLEQIRAAYIRHTNDSLGGLSPYSEK